MGWNKNLSTLRTQFHTEINAEYIIIFKLIYIYLQYGKLNGGN